MTTTMHGFELIRDEQVEEINTRAKLFRHIETGAELLSMENDDENKVFGITFRTPPKDSTGVPHIMEHSVLCGSRKYPLKEPFIELIKGSLNTFLNAMTYADKTTYPVASQNLQDFYNLVDVYMDAVLHPLIPEETLQQEGWHYELDSPDGELTYKGVVFNEMKGVYSSPDSLLYRNAQQALYPDITYGVDSGGDPAAIPDLTYAQFKEFHEVYYHPSNARLYFYGDDPLERRLAQAQSYLKEFKRKEVDSSVPLQQPFDAPQRHNFTYEAGEGDGEGGKAMMMVSWMLPEKEDKVQTMMLGLLSYMLVGTPASPLRKALLESELGAELTGGGLSTTLRQMSFSTGLKGIAAEDCDKIEALVLNTLGKIAEEGIDTELIEAALNMTEFHLRENNTGSYPRGLSLMLRALTTWLHDKDPLALVRYEDALATVKETLSTGSGALQDLIRLHLLDNQHRITVLLTPEAGVQKAQEEAETKALLDARNQMDDAAITEVIEKAKKLKELQETPDSADLLASLPSLNLADMDKKNKILPIAVSQYREAELLYHDLFTNGIIYLELGFDLGSLPQEWLPYVGLFGRALVEIGTETEDEVQIAQRIRRKTGGISPSTLTMSRPGMPHGISKLFLSGKAAVDKMDDFVAILHDLLLTVKLDNQDKVRQLVRKSKANQEASLVPSGHGVVNTRLRARLGGPDAVVEHTRGISKLFFLRELLDKVEQDWPSVLAILEGIRGQLINRNAALCNVTTDANTWGLFQPKLQGLLDALPAHSAEAQDWSFGLSPMDEGLIIPAQVNYVAKGANLYDLGYQLHGSVSVITKYLRTSWLWEKVRVLGGAYGGMCQFSRRTGIFTFLSYRDPNLLGTLENYDLTSQFLRDLAIDQRELERSIIGAIGDLDDYMLPDAKGYQSMVHHLSGESNDFRQQLRDEILSTTLADFHNFGEHLAAMNEKGIVCVLGSQDALDQANAEGSRQLKLRKVM